MTGGYRLSRTAEAELGETLLYVADRDSVERALHVHGQFVRAFEQIAERPDSGVKRPELTGDRHRWRSVFRWIVLDDPSDSPITVLRVAHGAQALGAILGPEGPEESR
ncbi:MAG: type II toxin-antitoxin system RelE/ParE family toxin [Planctomycetota bacterium]